MSSYKKMVKFAERNTAALYLEIFIWILTLQIFREKAEILQVTKCTLHISHNTH
jgi:hypothetical protein